MQLFFCVVRWVVRKLHQVFQSFFDWSWLLNLSKEKNIFLLLNKTPETVRARGCFKY